MRKRLIMALVSIVCLVFVLSLHSQTSNQFGYPMYEYYTSYHVQETGSENAVNAIYLFYRYYDTIFEALMLLFSIIAVIYLSIHESGDTYE